MALYGVQYHEEYDNNMIINITYHSGPTFIDDSYSNNTKYNSGYGLYFAYVSHNYIGYAFCSIHGHMWKI